MAYILKVAARYAVAITHIRLGVFKIIKSCPQRTGVTVGYKCRIPLTVVIDMSVTITHDFMLVKPLHAGMDSPPDTLVRLGYLHQQTEYRSRLV